jgi:hypothetical protein
VILQGDPRDAATGVRTDPLGAKPSFSEGLAGQGEAAVEGRAADDVGTEPARTALDDVSVARAPSPRESNQNRAVSGAQPSGRTTKFPGRPTVRRTGRGARSGPNVYYAHLGGLRPVEVSSLFPLWVQIASSVRFPCVAPRPATLVEDKALSALEGKGAVPEGELIQRFKIAPTLRPPGNFELEMRCLVRTYRVLRGELCSPYRVPWRRRLAALRRGFTARTAVLYQLDRNDPALYVPDIAFARRGYKINGFFNPIVGNKLVLSQVLAGYGVPHPRVLAVVQRGRLIDIEDHLAAASALEALAVVLSRSPTLVFRPHWAGAGEGIFFLRGGDGGGWSINGVAATPAEVAALVAGLDRYVVTAFVQQAAYAAEIFPAAANTLRVLTLADADGPFVAAAVHRFGTTRSFPIDNWHQGRGGLCTSIDTESATLGKSATLDANGKVVFASAHPETGAPIEGVRIPGLAAALDGFLRTARCFPGAPCVGWDAIITDDGFSILEGNSPPGLYVWQVHAPLLANPRIARFFAASGFRVPGGAGV